MSSPPAVIYAPSPNFDAGRATTTGIVLHSTRGGVKHSLMEEFNSTKDYFSKVSSQVSAHSIAGPGIIARCVKTSDRAWHARWFNGTHLGLEIVQCFLGDKLDESALDAGAWECANWSKQYNIPVVHDINNGFAQHFEVPPGVEDKKSDISPPFDIDDFLRRVVYYKGLLM